ncbi:MAG: 3'(2'),5'-bisphosphate nucleotidase CysQ [Spirochaetes bacterium]|nr:3'(2'),5'-bisphosphate nucleotidase CysQ [Spirochaetota bacterium]
MLKLAKELDIAKKAALSAGKEILRIYQTDFEVTYKDDKSPLTKADQQANNIIVEQLSKNFPDHAILSEESKDDLQRLNNPWCWIVDPLDGTKEFLKKNDEFTVNIALTLDHQVVLGVIYAPCLDELYFAVKDQGSFIESQGEQESICVSKNTEDICLVASRSHMSEKLQKLVEIYQINKIQSKGSSLKGCLVAKGDADIYYRFGPTMEWDTAAMHCIAVEAGGIFKQLDDSEMLYNRENSLNDKGFYILNHPDNKLNINQ